MSSPEKIEALKGALNNRGNYVTVGRTASGLLLGSCVDRRFANAGHVVRSPGDSLGGGTVLVMRNEASSLREGVVMMEQKAGAELGGHRDTCAYDHKLVTLLGMIARREPKVMELYGELGERVNRQLPPSSRVRFDESVSFRAERALDILGDHQPDELIEEISKMPESDVVTPGPATDHADAYIINTDPSGLVLAENVLPAGIAYMDTNAKAVTQSALPYEFMPDAVALTSATGVLVGESHGLDVVVTEGQPGAMKFDTFFPSK